MDRLIPIHHGGIVYINSEKAEGPEHRFFIHCTLSILAFSNDRSDIPKKYALCQVISNLPFQYKKLDDSNNEISTIITENQLHGKTVILPINILK